MSDKPISVGDLVMVVRGHRCQIGNIRTVSSLSEPSRFRDCSICGELWEQTTGTVANFTNGYSHPVAWLLRIDPPAIPESECATNGEKEKV